MKFSRQQIIFAAGVILFAIVAALLVVQFSGRPRYVAIRLDTGELYFGKMTWFPKPKLSNIWVLNLTQNGGVSLDQFKNLVWQPVEPMHISRDKIVFWAYLAPESPVVRAIEGRIPVQPQPQQQQLPQQPQLLPSPQPSPQPTQ
jgi:hypothetical protein